MRYLQTIDGARNAVNDVWALEDDDYATVMQGDLRDVVMAVEDLVDGRDDEELGPIFTRMWSNRVPKSEAPAIHATLVYDGIPVPKELAAMPAGREPVPERPRNVQVFRSPTDVRCPVSCLTEEEYGELFVGSADIEFDSDARGRLGDARFEQLLETLDRWVVRKSAAQGIHGTLFVGLDFKKVYFPDRTHEGAANPPPYAPGSIRPPIPGPPVEKAPPPERSRSHLRKLRNKARGRRGFGRPFPREMLEPGTVHAGGAVCLTPRDGLCIKKKDGWNVVPREADLFRSKEDREGLIRAAGRDARLYAAPLGTFPNDDGSVGPERPDWLPTGEYLFAANDASIRQFNETCDHFNWVVCDETRSWLVICSVQESLFYVGEGSFLEVAIGADWVTEYDRVRSHAASVYWDGHAGLVMAMCHAAEVDYPAADEGDWVAVF